MDPLEASQRRCRSCGQVKPFSEFDIRADTGKPASLCRPCRRIYQRERYVLQHPDLKRTVRRLSAGITELPCTRCRLIKPVSEFPPVQRGGDRLQSWCRACFAEVNSGNYPAYYERAWGHIHRRRRMRRVEVQEMVVDHLLRHPCVDCGESDILVLEFDHVGEKRANVSTMVHGSRSWKDIRAEIEKCDVRCANCHRRRTLRAAGGFRLRVLRPRRDSNARPSVP